MLLKLIWAKIRNLKVGFRPPQKTSGGLGPCAPPGSVTYGGFQRVQLQRLKFCNWMIFAIVSLLIHAVWI